MAEHGLSHGRGTFSCRIDGRAGYLHVWDDRLELVRSGRRGPQVLGPEVIPMHLVTAVTTGKPGRLLTSVELVAAGGYLELKLPSIDAPRVAELISLLASQAPIPADVPFAVPAPSMPLDPMPLDPMPLDPMPLDPMPLDPMPLDPMPWAVAPPVIPAQVAEPVLAESVTSASEMSASLPADFVMPDFSMKVEMPEWTPLAEDDATPAAAPVDLAEIVSQREYVVAEVEMPQWTPLPTIDGLDEVDEVLLRTLESPGALANPAGLALPKVEMPQWTPLPETDQPDTDMPEMVLSQIVLDELNATPEPVWVATAEPITEIEPLPEGSVLAAAAALAELESMLNEIPMVPLGDVHHADVEMADVEMADDEMDLVAEAREIFALTAPAPDGSDGASIPAQPSEAVLTLAAAALLGGSRGPVEETPEPTYEPAPRPERPADLSPDLERRLAGLEVLRNSGIMSDADFLLAEAELLESVASS